MLLDCCLPVESDTPFVGFSFFLVFFFLFLVSFFLSSASIAPTRPSATHDRWSAISIRCLVSNCACTGSLCLATGSSCQANTPQRLIRGCGFKISQLWLAASQQRRTGWAGLGWVADRMGEWMGLRSGELRPPPDHDHEDTRDERLARCRRISQRAERSRAVQSSRTDELPA